MISIEDDESARTPLQRGPNQFNTCRDYADKHDLRKHIDAKSTAGIARNVVFKKILTGCDQFQKEVPFEIMRTPTSVNEPAFLFSWEFVVPEDSDLSDPELLERAVQLSHKSEFRESRREFHEWRRKLITKGVSAEEAVAEMIRCLLVYNDIAGRALSRKRTITALQVAAIVGPPRRPCAAWPGYGSRCDLRYGSSTHRKISAGPQSRSPRKNRSTSK